MIILLLICIQHSDDNSSKDEEMEQKISKEINEVLGKTSLNDPDADIVLTEYLSDREEAEWDFKIYLLRLGLCG